MALQPSWRMLAISAAVSVMLTACGGGSDNNNTPQNRPLPVVPIDAGYSGDNGDSSIIPHSSPVLSVNNTPNGTLRPSARNTVTLQLLDPSGAPIPGTRRVRVDLPEGVTFPGVGQSGIVTFVDGVATFDIVTGSSCTRNVPLNLTDLATSTPLQANLEANCGSGGGSGTGGGSGGSGSGTGGSSIIVPDTGGGGNNANGGGSGGNTGTTTTPNHLEILVNGSPDGKLVPGRENTIEIKLCKGATDDNCAGGLVNENPDVKVKLPDGVQVGGSNEPTVKLTGGKATIPIPADANIPANPTITATPANGDTDNIKPDEAKPEIGNGNKLVVTYNPGTDNEGKLIPGQENTIEVKLVGPDGKTVEDNSPVTIGLPNIDGTVTLEDGTPVTSKKPSVPLKSGKTILRITPDAGTPANTDTTTTAEPCKGDTCPGTTTPAMDGADTGKDKPTVGGGTTGEPTHLEVIVNPGDPAKTGKLIPGEPNTIQVRLCKGATATTTPCPDADIVKENPEVNVDLPDGVKFPDGSTDPKVRLTDGIGEIILPPESTITVGDGDKITATSDDPNIGDGSTGVTGGGNTDPVIGKIEINKVNDINCVGSTCGDAELTPNENNPVEVTVTKDGQPVPKGTPVKVDLPDGVTCTNCTDGKIPVGEGGKVTIDIDPGNVTGDVTITVADPDDANTAGSVTVPVAGDKAIITTVNGQPVSDTNKLQPGMGNDVGFKLTDASGAPLTPSGGKAKVTLEGGATFPDGTKGPKEVTVTNGEGQFPIITDGSGTPVTVKVTNPDTNTTTTADANTATADKDPIPVGDGDGEDLVLACKPGQDKATAELTVNSSGAWAVWDPRTTGSTALSWKGVFPVTASNTDGEVHDWWTNPAKGNWGFDPGTIITPNTADGSFPTTDAVIFRTRIKIDTLVDNATVTWSYGTTGEHNGVFVDDSLNSVTLMTYGDSEDPNTTPPTDTNRQLDVGAVDEATIDVLRSLVTGSFQPGKTNYILWKVTNGSNANPNQSAHSVGTPNSPVGLAVHNLIIEADCRSE